MNILDQAVHRVHFDEEQNTMSYSYVLYYGVNDYHMRFGIH